MGLGPVSSLGATHTGGAGLTATHAITAAVPANSTVAFMATIDGTAKSLVGFSDDQGNKYEFLIQKAATNLWVVLLFTTAGLPIGTVVTATFSGNSTSVRAIAGVQFTGRGVLERSTSGTAATAAYSLAPGTTTNAGDVSLMALIVTAVRANSNQTGSNPAHAEIVDSASVWSLVMIAADSIPNGTAVTQAGNLASAGTWHALALVFNEYAAGTFDAEVTADSPVARWKFDEPSGAVADDAVGSADGTYVNAPTYSAAGVVKDGGTAVQVVAASSEEITLPISLDSVSSFEVWFEWPDDGLNPSVLLRDHSTGVGGTVLYGSGGSAIVRVGGTQFTLTGTTEPVIQNLFRHQLVITRNGTAANVYLDGVLVGSFVSALTASASPIHLGRDGSGATFFGAKFDEAIHYESELSAARVLAHYVAGIQPVPAAAGGGGGGGGVRSLLGVG